jgi:methionyl aminopeptidase
MIILKSERDLELMRPAGVVAGTVLEEVASFIQPGITTREVDDFAAARIKFYEAKSAFLGYRKYPCNICISVNEQVVHGLAGCFIGGLSGIRRGRWRLGGATCRRNG